MPPKAAPAVAAAGAASDAVGDAMRSLGLHAADRCAKCNAAASMLGVTCKHCRARFCLPHALPEAHGCGADAASAARCVAAG